MFELKMFEDFPDFYRVAPAANSIPACVEEGRGGEEEEVECYGCGKR
jgi:hypothetical protein